MKKSKILQSIPQNFTIYHIKNLFHHIKHIVFHLWLKYGVKQILLVMLSLF
jgi:hypothetical protein